MSELPSDFFNRPLADVDPEIAEVLGSELERQQHTLEMIASENFAPVAILECQGSVLTNKYAEGYPGRRYYGGCEYIDVAEQCHKSGKEPGPVIEYIAIYDYIVVGELRGERCFDVTS